jgi:membrane protein implicated in regulation of membrane protease activity
MDTFTTWWNSLLPLNQWFYVAAVFFSVFFLWQLAMALIGIGGGESDVDTHVDQAWEHHTPDDASHTMSVFKLFSLRSILAFFTLFTWAGALYLNLDKSVPAALTYAVFWGLAAFVLVSLLLNLMRRMTETGNIRVATCVGSAATVYLDIPPGGEGEIRVPVSGVMTHLKARATAASPLKAGTPVRVVRVTGPNSVEVELPSQSSSGKETP